MEVSEAKALITVDGARRKGKTAPIKAAGRRGDGRPRVARDDRRRPATPATTAPMKDGRDVWYHEALEAADAECPAEPLDAEHPLFILYSSGSTAKPKGILHTTGGYLTGVACTHQVRLRPQARGRRLLVLGRRRLGHRPLLHRLRAAGQRRDVGDVRGRAGLPGQGHLVGARRALRRDDLLHRADGDPRVHEVGRRVPGEARPVERCGCSGTVGEPINPKAWLWYYKVIGGERCPIVDTWWQTETGAIMITTLPGAQDMKPGSAGTPLPGIEAAGRRRGAARRPARQQGLLVAARPWPAMLRTLYGDDDRFVETYWSKFGKDDVPRRRRRAQGRRRLLLGHRARRRRDQRLRPPHVDGRDRVGDRLAREGRRGRGASARPTRTPARRSPRS